MPDSGLSLLTRRKFLGTAAGSAGVAALAAPGSSAAPVQNKPSVVVAADGSGNFGPNTPKTKTSGIQEAVDAVASQGGGIVHLRRGVYLVDNVMPPPEEARVFGCGLRSIGLYDNITLRGEGMDQTIIRIAAKCNTNAILGWATSRAHIEDLTIDGAGLNAGYGIAVFGLDYGKGTAFTDVYLRRVKATGFGGSAIGVAGGRRVVIEQCTGADSKIGFELGSPSVDYWVLHCTAYGCTNGVLIFDPADKYNEAGNLRPRVIGGLYDGEGKASGVALWDCFEPMIAGVMARRGVTTNIQIAPSGRKTITTPVGGGLIEACLADGSVGSNAGRYGIGACQDGVRVVACSVVGNEDVGILAAPGDGGQVGIHNCTFRAGADNVQRYAVAPRGERVALLASENLYDGPNDRFIGNIGALAVPGSSLSENLNFNPVGLLPSVSVPPPGMFVSNPHPYAADVYLHSGQVRAVTKRDVAGKTARVAAASNVSVRLHPGEAISLEYTERPEWSWFGL